MENHGTNLAAPETACRVVAEFMRCVLEYAARIEAAASSLLDDARRPAVAHSDDAAYSPPRAAARPQPRRARLLATAHRNQAALPTVGMSRRQPVADVL